MNSKDFIFWNQAVDAVLGQLNSRPNGLTEDEVVGRLKEGGRNVIASKGVSWFLLLLRQFKSPISIILLVAAILSFFLQDSTDAIIILFIVFVSGFLSFWQERGAADAIKKLLEIIRIKVHVIRDGVKKDVPVEEIVPGDITELSAGDMIPGDCLIIESKDLFINEASLTGESYPCEKYSCVTEATCALSKRFNVLFMGTNVISGTCKAVVVNTGQNTEFGKISSQVQQQQPETDFEKGIRQFGNLLVEVTLILVIAIFAINVFFHKPVLESFLFSLAIAVGLTPQLLPAIISVNLAYGARKMADKKVIVKVLASIENFGSMNVLCSDKTGTLTEGMVQLHANLDYAGHNSNKVFIYALINASLESGFANPIDVAIRQQKMNNDISAYVKTDEIPYDFIRKRLSVLAKYNNDNILITKGAFSNILDVCDTAEADGGTICALSSLQDTLKNKFEELSAQGLRVLAVAYKNMKDVSVIHKEDEIALTFLGFLVFNDPVKEGIRETLAGLADLGIQMKIITGDNSAIAKSMSSQVGLQNPVIITGPELYKMSNDALVNRVNEVNIFAEVEPNQKERIIMALKKAGKVVGYIGDGVNDASALHAADVGISVDSAVDAAKGAAHIVLLEKNLNVLIEGVREGRKTFANTLKYVFMATSANFGNMFSMAGASLFLPFLPLLPKQILLMNVLTDFPEMTIATDSVDDDMILMPHKWDIKFIRNFMIVFGIISSVFDYATFGVLILLLHADTIQFRTGWFIESIVSATLIVLVVRTRKPFIKSKPGKYLLITTLAIAVFTVFIPYTPLKGLFGFTGLPLIFYAALAGIIAGYILLAEIAKHFFYFTVNRSGTK